MDAKQIKALKLAGKTTSRLARQEIATYSEMSQTTADSIIQIMRQLKTAGISLYYQDVTRKQLQQLNTVSVFDAAVADLNKRISALKQHLTL